MLAASDLIAGYNRTPVLHGVSLDVGHGERVSIVGRNGAGKTTTLRVMTGLLRPWSGSFELDGVSLAGLAPEAIAVRGITHIPEGRGLFGGMSVRENLLLGGFTRPKADLEAEMEGILGFFPELSSKLRAPAGALSGGQQQMLAIARGLMSRPRLLMLDEPTVGLGPIVVERLLDLLPRLQGEYFNALLLVEQDASVALALTQRIYVLSAGRVVSAGATGDVDRESLIAGYLGLSTLEAR